MKKLMTMLLMLGLAWAGGCGRSDPEAGERLFADMSANMRELSAILTSVTDEASAHAAVPRIAAVREKMRDCARRARELPMPDPETDARMNAQMQEVMAEVMPQIATAQARIFGDPALATIIAPALEGMENDL